MKTKDDKIQDKYKRSLHQLFAVCQANHQIKQKIDFLQIKNSKIKEQNKNLHYLIQRKEVQLQQTKQLKKEIEQLSKYVQNISRQNNKNLKQKQQYAVEIKNKQLQLIKLNQQLLQNKNYYQRYFMLKELQANKQKQPSQKMIAKIKQLQQNQTKLKYELSQEIKCRLQLQTSLKDLKQKNVQFLVNQEINNVNKHKRSISTYVQQLHNNPEIIKKIVKQQKVLPNRNSLQERIQAFFFSQAAKLQKNSIKTKDKINKYDALVCKLQKQLEQSLVQINTNQHSLTMKQIQIKRLKKINKKINNELTLKSFQQDVQEGNRKKYTDPQWENRNLINQIIRYKQQITILNASLRQYQQLIEKQFYSKKLTIEQMQRQNTELRIRQAEADKKLREIQQQYMLLKVKVICNAEYDTTFLKYENLIKEKNSTENLRNSAQSYKIQNNYSAFSHSFNLNQTNQDDKKEHTNYNILSILVIAFAEIESLRLLNTKLTQQLKDKMSFNNIQSFPVQTKLEKQKQLIEKDNQCNQKAFIILQELRMLHYRCCKNKSLN